MAQFGRTRQSFPTRQYRYAIVVPEGEQMDELALEPGTVYQFITGRDAMPAPIPKADGRTRLHDPLAQLVLFGSEAPPLSLRALLATLDATALSQQRSFVVADGGQIPWSPQTDDLQRNFRLAIVRERTGAGQPDLLISASTDIDSPTNFLQVIGWDDRAGAFQYYERRDGVWVWAGNSWDALTPDARGHGPFDSHVNGALNMKELKVPWVHWHSPSASVSDEVLAPADPLRTEPVWTARRLADEFERTIARPGVRRWNDSRFSRLTTGGALTRLPEFFRQVLGTSTVNLASSATSSAALAGGADVRLPPTFLVDTDSLLGVVGLAPAVTVPVVRADVYRAALTQFAVKVSDGRHEFAGETHFVFVVPEPAFEDVLVVETLIGLGILSERLAAALLMVDFQNPVFSARREALLQYVPAEARLGDAAGFADALVAAIGGSAAAASNGSAEAEFLANWAIPDPEWRAACERRIETFAAAVSARCATPSSFAPVFELAESRRREFRKRKLAEFRLTTPTTNIPETAPLLEFEIDGTVRRKGAAMALTRFDAPGFLRDLTPQAAERWSEWISDSIDEARDNTGGGAVNFGPRPQFFNQLRTPADTDAVTKDIEWPAFPRVIQINSLTDLQRWRTADGSRDVQDEYCEWSVTRDAANKIVRVTFTSEGPEYWRFLASVDPARLLALYKEHVSPDVKMQDLVRQGSYVPRNRWNTSTTNGAMHLVQRSNTLGAEIELAAAATLVRHRNGAPITEAQELIACGQYGEPQRHSDPFIGAQVNELARARADITLANPVGLYIASLSVAGWETPDTSDPSDYWKITRGTKEKALRAVYEVPAAKGFAVGDIKIAGRKIDFGAQIADFIRIKLTGLATRIGQSTAAPLNGCVEFAEADEAATATVPSVKDVLAERVFDATR
jgi:hypothetical protein